MICLDSEPSDPLSTGLGSATSNWSCLILVTVPFMDTVIEALVLSGRSRRCCSKWVATCCPTSIGSRSDFVGLRLDGEVGLEQLVVGPELGYCTAFVIKISSVYPKAPVVPKFISSSSLSSISILVFCSSLKLRSFTVASEARKSSTSEQPANC